MNKLFNENSDKLKQKILKAKDDKDILLIIGFCKNNLLMKNEEILYFLRSKSEFIFLKRIKYLFLFIMIISSTFLFFNCFKFVELFLGEGLSFFLAALAGISFFGSWYFFEMLRNEVKNIEPFSSDLFSLFSLNEKLISFEEKTPLIIGIKY